MKKLTLKIAIGVPLERSERMVEALKKAGGNVKFTVYPEAGPRLLDGSLQQP